MTRAYVNNSHIRGPVTLTPIAERLAVELSQPVFYDLGLSRLGFEHPTLPLAGRTLLPKENPCILKKKIYQKLGSFSNNAEDSIEVNFFEIYQVKTLYEHIQLTFRRYSKLKNNPRITLWILLSIIFVRYNICLWCDKILIDFYIILRKTLPRKYIVWNNLFLFCRSAKVLKLPWLHQHHGLRMSLPATSVTNPHNSSVTVAKSIYAKPA